MDLIRSGIRTGARNYARGSASITYTAPNTGSNADNYSYYNISVGKVKSGDIFYVGADDISILAGSPDKFTILMLNDNKYSMSQQTIMTLQDKYCFVKATSDDDNASIAIYIGLAGSTRGNKITFSKLMVAKSNIKVDWQLAPEDVASLSGGVIRCITATYNTTSHTVQKGPQHEPDKNTAGLHQDHSGRCLAFGSLDAMCQFLGSIVEDSSLQFHHGKKQQYGGYGFGHAQRAGAISDKVWLAKRADNKYQWSLRAGFEGGQLQLLSAFVQPHDTVNIFPRVRDKHMVCMEGDSLRRRITHRKEVAA